MKKSFSIIAAALAMAACSHERLAVETYPEPLPDGEYPHGEEMVLGRKRDNPFSVVNMANAFHSYYHASKAAVQGVDVYTTDYYVRFLPENQEQLDRLESLGLDLLDHPLDCEIEKDGDWYHDPSVPEGEITWQYTVVGRDFEFPEDIEYEILEECFLPEHSSGAGSKAILVDWDAVEAVAFEQTGNGNLKSRPASKGSGGGTPRGRISIVDEKLGPEPIGVAGVRVMCNSFVRIAKAYTDEQGYYKMSKSFSSKPRYRIVFKNKKGFGIGLNTIIYPASYSGLGKHSAEGVSRVVTSRSNRNLFCRCVVNNAVYDYFNSCKEGGQSMPAPPANLRLWIFQKLDASSAVMLQQGVLVDDTFIGEFLGEYARLVKKFLPDITIGAKGKDDYASLYAAAIHECAHASHFKKVGKAYWQKVTEFIVSSWLESGDVYGVGDEKNHGYAEVSEMWAYYVQSRLYSDRYPSDKSIFGTGWWFSPQVFFYLDERGLTRFKIIEALGKEVNSREKLEEELIKLYPDFKTTIQVAFNRYN